MERSFDMALSAEYSFADGRAKYRVLYLGETWQDDLTCEQAFKAVILLNDVCGCDEEEVVA